MHVWEELIGVGILINLRDGDRGGASVTGPLVLRARLTPTRKTMEPLCNKS